MFDLLKQACETASRAGCEFADARYLEIRRQRIASRDHALSSCSDGDDRGFGVRVLYRGAWGFASAPGSDAAEIDRVVGLAIRIARVSALAARAGGVHWAPEEPISMEFHSPCEIDPFAVALEDKAGLLLSANAVMLRNESVKRALGYLHFKRVRRWYVSTDGSRLHSDVTTSEAVISAIAVDANDFQ